MSTPQNLQYSYPQGPPPPAKKTDKAKVILLSAFAVIVGLILLGSCINLLSDDDSTSAVPSPTATVTVIVTEAAEPNPTEGFTEGPTEPNPTEGFTEGPTEPKPEPEPKIANTMTNGQYEVGVDVQAGQYKTQVADGDLCYWERSKDDRGDSIIANELFDGPGRQSITIKKGEFFKTEDCGTWKKVG